MNLSKEAVSVLKAVVKKPADGSEVCKVVGFDARPVLEQLKGAGLVWYSIVRNKWDDTENGRLLAAFLKQQKVRKTAMWSVRMLDAFEQSILEEVALNRGWQGLIENCAERRNGYHLRDLRPAYERLVAEGIIRNRGDGFMVTEWITEEIEAGAKVITVK